MDYLLLEGHGSYVQTIAKKKVRQRSENGRSLEYLLACLTQFREQ